MYSRVGRIGRIGRIGRKIGRKQHQWRVRKRGSRRRSSPSRTAGWIRLCRSSRRLMGFILTCFHGEWGYKQQHLYVFVINCHILGSISRFLPFWQCQDFESACYVDLNS